MTIMALSVSTRTRHDTTLWTTFFGPKNAGLGDGSCEAKGREPSIQAGLLVVLAARGARTAPTVVPPASDSAPVGIRRRAFSQPPRPLACPPARPLAAAAAAAATTPVALLPPPTTDRSRVVSCRVASPNASRLSTLREFV